jgi:hypothetical protein
MQYVSIIRVEVVQLVIQLSLLRAVLVCVTVGCHVVILVILLKLLVHEVLIFLIFVLAVYTSTDLVVLN